MKVWWSALQQDPARPVVYTDFMPGELDEFLGPVRQGAIRMFLFLVDGEVGGAYYLHDEGRDAAGVYAWLGTYILPPSRGHLAAYAWRMVQQTCAQEGRHRIFAAIREQNRPAHRFITQQMGFTRLGKYPAWSFFEGHLDAVLLYTLRRQDERVAWMAATQRAAQFRQLPRPETSRATRSQVVPAAPGGSRAHRRVLTRARKQAISTREHA
jgi:RimJ/RimL family protein N-acetyltransferase